MVSGSPPVSEGKKDGTFWKRRDRGERVEVLLKSSVQRAMDMTVEAFLWMEVLGPLIETFYDMRDPI